MKKYLTSILSAVVVVGFAGFVAYATVHTEPIADQDAPEESVLAAEDTQPEPPILEMAPSEPLPPETIVSIPVVAPAVTPTPVNIAPSATDDSLTTASQPQYSDDDREQREDRHYDDDERDEEDDDDD